MKKAFFITGTDTGVGKTIVMLVLARFLRREGLICGVFKPVQSGVGDSEFLQKELNLDDDIRTINPYFSREPIAPHLALKRQGIKIDFELLRQRFVQLQNKYDVVLVEGAGGLLVPLDDRQCMADLAKNLQAEVVIVSRLGLGTINHTLLTVNEAQRRGLKVAGVIFSEGSKSKKGIPERTNMSEIASRIDAPVLGVVPYLKTFDQKTVIQRCRRKIDLQPILSSLNQTPSPWEEWDREHVWHPFTQMKDWMNQKPLVIERGAGSYLIDTKGHRYIDGVSSLWVNVHGHCRRELDEALSMQASKIAHSTQLGLANTAAIDLARKLIDIAPAGLKKVFYSDNGSTSVEIAIKMAYQYWQNTGLRRKTKLVHLANSYHGDTLGSVSIGGIDLFHKVYRGLIFKTIKLDFPDCYRAPTGEKYPDFAFKAVDRFAQILKEDHANIAALVVEPLVQGAAGMIMWPRGILKRFEQLCREYNVFFICDEVATGFGRTGKMFACNHEDVKPDILCVAKGLTGGYLPLAATLTTQKVFDGFVFPYNEMKTFFHGHSYTGNPLACAVALRNLELFESEDLIRRMQPRIELLAKELSRLNEIPAVGDIRQRGFMIGIELVRNKATKEPFPWEQRIGVRVCECARDYGVILRPLGNVIVLMPPLSISPEEIKLLVQATENAIKDVCVNM